MGSIQGERGMLPDARADFRQWRNRLTALDEQLCELRVGAREFESLTNIGQGLVASELVDSPTSQDALSAMIFGGVGDGPGCSQPNLGCWLPKGRIVVDWGGVRNRVVIDEGRGAL
jgi:hypothetical protein